MGGDLVGRVPGGLGRRFGTTALKCRERLERAVANSEGDKNATIGTGKAWQGVARIATRKGLAWALVGKNNQADRCMIRWNACLLCGWVFLKFRLSFDAW